MIIFFTVYDKLHLIYLDYFYSYESKLRSILEALNNFKPSENLHNNYDTTLQNIVLILRFIHHLIQIKNEDFFIMYPTIITHLLQWIQYLDLHEQVMSIFQTLIINVRIHNIHMDQNLQCDINSNLEESLNVSKIHKLKIVCHLKL